MIKFEGGCLCGTTTYVSTSKPINPHLCSCTMCQKSSGAPTVAWLEFTLKDFTWGNESVLGTHQSSAKTKRCFCKQCGSFIGAINDGAKTIAITIASLNDPNIVVPGKQHSYKESGPFWWEVRVNY